MDAEGMDATREDVAAHLHATFAPDHHERVRGQLARLEDAPGVHLVGAFYS